MRLGHNIESRQVLGIFAFEDYTCSIKLGILVPKGRYFSTSSNLCMLPLLEASEVSERSSARVAVYGREACADISGVYRLNQMPFEGSFLGIRLDGVSPTTGTTSNSTSPVVTDNWCARPRSIQPLLTNHTSSLPPSGSKGVMT